jgi:molecular chaperone DnaJ
MRLRIRGAGEAGPNGGPPGDLYIVVHIADHAVFSRDGKDIVVEEPISFAQAALGDEVKVPTLDGAAMVTIPPGTQTGTVFRLKGKGLPNLSGHGQGDEFVRVTVRVPTRLTPEQKELVRQLGRSIGDAGGEERRKSVFDGFKRRA